MNLFVCFDSKFVLYVIYLLLLILFIIFVVVLARSTNDAPRSHR